MGYLRPLEFTDLPKVAPDRTAKVISEKLQASFERRRLRGDKYPLIWAINEVFKREFWTAGACRVTADILLVFAPFVLKCVLFFSPSPSLQHVYSNMTALQIPHPLLC